MRNAVSDELVARLRFPSDEQRQLDWLRLRRALRKPVWANLSVLLFVVVFVLALGLSVEAKQLQSATVNVGAYALQCGFLVLVLPVFIPPATLQRIQRKYLPIQQSDITRRWTKMYCVTHKLILALVACLSLAAVIAGAGIPYVLNQIVWQLCLLWIIGRLAVAAMPYCGRLHWLANVFFLFYAIGSVYLAQVVIIHHHSAMILAAPFWLLAMIPSWIQRWQGGLAATLFCSFAFLFVQMWAGGTFQLFKLGRRELIKLCRAWRQLPDAENLVLGNLNYPASPVEPEKLNDRPLGRLIREHIHLAHPSNLIDRRRWQLLRLGSIAFICVFGASWAFIATLNKMNGVDTPPEFAIFGFVYHGPAIFAVFSIAPLLKNRVSTLGGMIRIATRGFWFDTFCMCLCLAPFLIYSVYLSGDFVGPSQHLLTCLCVATGIRFSAVMMLHFAAEYRNLLVAISGGLLAMMFVLLPAAALFGLLFGVKVEERLFVYWPLLTAAIAIVGADRIAARLHVVFKSLQTAFRRVKNERGSFGSSFEI